jgi:acetolactate synthase-1/2/3 large subunit
VLILRDDAYGMIRWKQANMGFADFGLTYGNPDFVKYAESYGATGHRVDSAEGLPDILDKCLDAKGVQLIDCPIDYSENDRILNKDIRELSAALDSGGRLGLKFEKAEGAEASAPVSAGPTLA